MKFCRITVALALIALSACAPTPRFEWGNYEMALYRYHKQPDQRDEYREALTSAVQRGEATNRVAPGLYAELGYLSLEDGDTQTAIVRFEQEAALFPESAALMGRIVEQLRQPAPAEPQSALEPQS